MPLTELQARVLANIERVVPLAYKVNVTSPRQRYQLDGTNCTQQVTALVVRRMVTKDAFGRLRRTDASSHRKLPAVERQPASPDTTALLRACLLAPVDPPRKTASLLDRQTS